MTQRVGATDRRMVPGFGRRGLSASTGLYSLSRHCWVSGCNMMQFRRVVSASLFAAALLAGCGQDDLTSAREQHRAFVGEKPQQAEVVGTYVLTDQTIIGGGVSALGNRACHLVLRPDGSFSITNYPNWRVAASAHTSGFDTFISTTGRWAFTLVGQSYGYSSEPKDIWGIEFSEAESKIDATAFTGPKPPYGLITILGDPDSKKTIRFERKEKKEHPTKPSTATE
jgi:hypothetical protein